MQILNTIGGASLRHEGASTAAPTVTPTAPVEEVAPQVPQHAPSEPAPQDKPKKGKRPTRKDT